MAHKLSVFTTVGSGSYITCDAIKEKAHGILLLDDDGSEIGYVPYDQLGFVEPNVE